MDFLLGDSSKARNNLNWKPKIGFQELVRIMTEYDLEQAEREAHALQIPQGARPRREMIDIHK